MPFKIYDRDGKAHIIDHMIDVKELLATGKYFKENPKAPKAKTIEEKPPVNVAGVEIVRPPEEPDLKKQERRPEDNITYKTVSDAKVEKKK